MHDTSVQAAHHAPPTSFIRKHIFSQDHKVIGKQYYALALFAAALCLVIPRGIALVAVADVPDPVLTPR